MLKGKAFADDFYIWQRDWRNPNLRRVVESEKSAGIFYVLTGEFRSGKSPVIVYPNWQSLKKSKIPVVPVFRVYVSCMPVLGKSPEAFADKLISDFLKLKKTAGIKINELQLDLDCPESKLPVYAGFLKTLRRKLPGIRLSITVLPCHLNNAAFKYVTAQVDYYVLQAHGLDIPRKLDDKVSLFNKRMAVRAIRKAMELGRPFLVALPTYAYLLTFDKKSGKFLYLNAEKTPIKKPGEIRKILAPDLTDLAAIVSYIRTLPGPCKGIVWFRLPVAGDRLNCSRKTVEILQSGKIPEKKLFTELRKGENGLIEIILRNDAVLTTGPIVLYLIWESRSGDFDLYAGFENLSKTKMPGILPVKLQGSAPPPGGNRPIGWFRCYKSRKLPKLRVEWK